jgi:hypothetical protein
MMMMTMIPSDVKKKGVKRDLSYSCSAAPAGSNSIFDRVKTALCKAVKAFNNSILGHIACTYLGT